MSAAERKVLRALAHAHGVQTSYTSVKGRRHAASDATLRGVLAALDVDASTPREVQRALRAASVPPIVEPAVVAWDGRLPPVPVRSGHTDRVWAQVEPVDADGDATTIEARAGGPGSLVHTDRPLPLGYHRLRVRVGRREAEARVISAPRSAPTLPHGTWGVFAPVHGLRSHGDWGVGGLTELDRLHAWVLARGGGLVATLPLFAAYLDEPFEPSPYTPISRLFWNELYLDVTRAPGFADVAAARELTSSPAFRAELEELRDGELVRPREAMAAKRRVLSVLAEAVLERPPEVFERWLARRSCADDYARFRAEVERTRRGWSAWPPPGRDGTLDGDPLETASGRYHLFVQWAADDQFERMARARREDGGLLALDLPLGVHADGYDVWRHRDVFATGASVGAAPDAFFRWAGLGVPASAPGSASGVRVRLSDRLPPAALQRVVHRPARPRHEPPPVVLGSRRDGSDPRRVRRVPSRGVDRDPHARGRPRRGRAGR
jgi:4-alpha-glucanotransferase